MNAGHLVARSVPNDESGVSLQAVKHNIDKNLVTRHLSHELVQRGDLTKLLFGYDLYEDAARAHNAPKLTLPDIADSKLTYEPVAHGGLGSPTRPAEHPLAKSKDAELFQLQDNWEVSKKHRNRITLTDPNSPLKQPLLAQPKWISPGSGEHSWIEGKQRKKLEQAWHTERNRLADRYWNSLTSNPELSDQAMREWKAHDPIGHGA